MSDFDSRLYGGRLVPNRGMTISADLRVDSSRRRAAERVCRLSAGTAARADPRRRILAVMFKVRYLGTGVSVR
jgi:hypothetical protein